MGFQIVKLWVEFSIWIWYSKIIIEIFKRFYQVYEFHEILWIFKQSMSYENYFKIMSFEVWCLFSHIEFEGELSLWVMRPWVVRWAIPMRRMSWVMSYELWVMSTWVWVIITMHCFWVFPWDCWHSTESIIR